MNYVCLVVNKSAKVVAGPLVGATVKVICEDEDEGGYDCQVVGRFGPYNSGDRVLLEKYEVKFIN